MKKLFIATVILTAMAFAEQAKSQARVHVNIGIGFPVYTAPRPVVVYDDPYPSREVVVVHQRPTVIYRHDDYCDRDDRYYRGRGEYHGNKYGWYKHRNYRYDD